MRSKKDKEFIAHASTIFNTDAGKQVLVALKILYVDTSCLEASPELTYYKLGQKELVQSLIRLLKEPDELEELVILDETYTTSGDKHDR